MSLARWDEKNDLKAATVTCIIPERSKEERNVCTLRRGEQPRVWKICARSLKDESWEVGCADTAGGTVDGLWACWKSKDVRCWQRDRKMRRLFAKRAAV